MVINLCWLRKAVGNVPSSKVLAERHPSPCWLFFMVTADGSAFEEIAFFSYLSFSFPRVPYYILITKVSHDVQVWKYVVSFPEQLY